MTSSSSFPGWEAALAAARTLAPAAQWRRSFAQAIASAASVSFAAVCTCPPGQFHEAQADVEPAHLWGLVEEIFVRFLPRIEQIQEGLAQAHTTQGAAYAPLESSRSGKLARQLREDVLAPAGIGGLINAFLLDSQKQCLGWVAIGDRRPSAELLAELGPALSEVVAAAAQTLQASIDLAVGCGVVLFPATDPALQSLTTREKQVVRLVGTGLSDANIARRLGISEQTVGSHLRRIYSKLSVHSRVELFSRAWMLAAPRSTIVSPDAV